MDSVVDQHAMGCFLSSSSSDAHDAYQKNHAWYTKMPNTYQDALSFMHESEEGKPLAIAITDRFHCITDVNEAWERLCGYNIEEVEGRTFRFMQGAMTDVQVLDQLNTCLLRGEAVEVIIVNYNKYGRQFHNYLQVKPLVDMDCPDKITHYLGILNDLDGSISIAGC